MLALVPCPARGERELTLTLDDAIAMARVQSVDAAVALDELKTAYWQWRSYRADRLPEITIGGKLPSYNDRYTSYMNEAGEYSFVRTHNLDATATLSINQNIPFTGGTISLSTSLDYMRQFEDGGSDRFLTVPVALTLEQPVFGVNTFKWDNRIEPVRFSEAKAAFLSATENVALATVNHFFTLVMSRENVAIAEQNLANANKLYSVAVEKREMGQISENDLRQMELNVLDAQSDLTDCKSTLKSDMFTLRSFLDLGEDVEIVPVVPDKVPEADVTYDDALTRALDNNKFAQNIRRRQLEADYEVAKAKGDMRQINLYAQVGITGTDRKFTDAYSRVRSNQLIEIGFEIPLLDWGVRKGKYNMARNNLNVVKISARQDEISIEEEVIMTVSDFNIQQQLIASAEEALDLSILAYNETKQRFIIGKADINSLTLSLNRQQQAQRNFISALQNYWLNYYKIRRLTLFDFATKLSLSDRFDFNGGKLIK